MSQSPPGTSSNPPAGFTLSDPPPAPTRAPFWLDRALNGLLAPNYTQGLLRFLVLVVGPIGILIFLAKIGMPLLTRQNWPLFVLFILPFWIAFECGANYIQSLYGLETRGSARKFLLATAFGLNFDILRIQNGELPHPERNPFIQIGGPGLVQVNYDSAAVFERPDGVPYVVGPNPRSYAIPVQGFHRLRQVVALRDHTMEWEINGRTRDGIVIRASNLQVVFRILPSATTSPVIKATYSYDPLAILRLVYREQYNNGAFEQVIQPLLRTQFRFVIESHTLKELLTSITPADITGLDPDFVSRNIPPAPITPTPRPAISNLFLNTVSGFGSAARAAGVQLEWINIGTWQFDTNRIIQQHVDAWQMELSNRNLVGAIPTARLQQDMIAGELKSNLQAAILHFASLKKQPGISRDLIVYRMISHFYGKLESIRNENPPGTIPGLDGALGTLLDYLNQEAKRHGATFI